MATTTNHTLKSFDEDLKAIRASVAEMGGLAEAAIAESVQALVGRDVEAAARIVEADRRVDEIEQALERLVVRTLARRAPMADDLREVIAALKMASIVERIADYAKNIAKRVPLLADSRSVDAVSILPAMARTAGTMVKDALDAFAARDAQKAADVCSRDQEVDDFYNSVFRTLLTHMMENPHTITAATHYLFIAKNLERIGDHATNLAETVYYAATGQQLGERPRGHDALAVEG